MRTPLPSAARARAGGGLQGRAVHVRSAAVAAAALPTARAGKAVAAAALPAAPAGNAIAAARRRRFRHPMIPPESPKAAPAGKAVAAARPGTAPESPIAVGPRLSPRRFRPGTAGTAALLSPHNDSCRRRHGSASRAGRAPLQSPTTAMPRASEEPARPA